MSQLPPENTRLATRVHLALHAELRIADTAHRFVIKNVSLSGVCLHTTLDFPVGTACHIALLLEGLDPPQRCEMEGTIVRAEPGEIGIVFSEIVGLLSFEHLHNLLLYNASESHRVTEELKHFRGLRHTG